MNRRALLIVLSAGLALASTPVLAAEEKKKGGGKGYTQFPLLTVFTAANASHHGTMSVDMGLYTDDDKLSAQIKSFQPRLQDAYLSRLQAYAGTLNTHSLADPDLVTGQLQQATDRVLGRSGAKVLLGSILLN